MKKRMTLLCICIVSIMQAQNFKDNVHDEFATEINKRLGNMDKSKVPHGLLLDYAFEFTDLQAYNGIIADTNAVSVGTFKDIYNTLLMAQVDTSKTDLLAPQNFKGQWNKERERHNAKGSKPHIALSALYYKYAKLDEKALDENLITVKDNQLHDKYINDEWQNPYLEKQTFAIAAPVLSVESLELEASIPQSLFYTNQSEDIDFIEIDFDDGNGYRRTSLGQIHQINYTEKKMYNWKIKVKLKSGSILYSHTFIAVQTPYMPSCLDDEVITKPLQGDTISATLQFDCVNGSNITKPLIVAEGFDPAILAPESDYGLNNLLGFKTSLSQSLDLNNLILNEYDIIYVNWNDSFATIEDNAALLEEVIDWVNHHKSGNKPNVVLGQSMGGLVARYALKTMEDNNRDHDTDLYISHDAPHQGANVPIAFQYLNRHIYGQFIQSPILEDLVIGLSDGNNQLYDVQTLADAPSARQMLRYYINTGGSEDPSFFNALQNDLQNLGYPKQTRNIAISNGSQCANSYNFDNGDNLFALDGSARTGWLSDLILGTFPFLNQILAGTVTAITFEPSFLLGAIPGNTELDMNFRARAMSYSGGEIYKGKITYTKTVLWTFPVTSTITSVSVTQNPINYSFDNYPGGGYNLPDLESEGDENEWYEYNINIDNVNNFSFIPTPSSLDIGNGSTPLNDGDYLSKYSVNNTQNSPFDNFTTSYNSFGRNEGHLSFNTKNGNWLAAELDNEPEVFDCSLACSDINIFGPESFCDDSTFSVAMGADDYEWSILGGGIVSMSEGSSPNSVTLSQINNESGYVWLYVNIVNDKCDDVSIQKKVHVGSPTVENIQQISDQAAVPHFSPATGMSTCDEIGIELNFAPSYSDVQEIEWEKITSDVMWSRDYASYNDRYAYIYPDCNETFEFRVRAKSNCGWSDWQDLSYEITSCDNNCPTGGGPSSGNISSDDYLIYPVPADTQLSIKMEEFGNNITLLTTPLNVKLYSSSGSGLIASDQDFTVSLANVDVSGLSPGTYLLVLTYEGESESHNIIIE